MRPSYRNQLWRMSGRLIARDGGAFSYAATLFRYAEPNGVVLYPASVSVVDELSGWLFAERRMERVGLGLADATTGVLAVRVGAWRLRKSLATGDTPAFGLDAKLDGVALVVHGARAQATLRATLGNAEHDEYSSIASNGTVAIDVDILRSVERRGSTTNFPTRRRAWAPVGEFRVQLDDGREIYFETSGSAETRVARRRTYLIERAGTVVTLNQGSYQFGQHPGSTWRTRHTRRILT